MGAATTQPSAYVVGVTGGIGSGKTTVCNRFTSRFGISIVDADLVAREVVEPGQPALSALADIFGVEILDSAGCLDRRKLKSIVFADAAKRQVLESILHPKIGDRMAQLLAEVDGPYCLLCVPLLAEGGRRKNMNRILVVDCPEHVQVARVMSRDKLTEDEVTAIMLTQASREGRLAIADDIILNDDTNLELDARVAELHDRYLKLAHAERLAAAR
jgi:dephospho-CoA kinase